MIPKGTNVVAWGLAVLGALFSVAGAGCIAAATATSAWAVAGAIFGAAATACTGLAAAWGKFSPSVNAGG
jgi:hypothetical protein